MEEAMTTKVNRDTLSEILSRISDGPSLASAACACADLRRAIVDDGEDKLWEDLCHSTWPSTNTPRAKDLIGSSSGHRRFFSDTFPFLLYGGRSDKPSSSSSPAPSNVEQDQLVSFVDLFVGGECVFSKVVPMPEGSWSWFLDCPFKLEAMAADDEQVRVLGEMTGDMRVSWVMFDRRTGRAANLSGSTNTTTVARNWPADGDLLVCFGCPIAVDRLDVSAAAAEFVIEVRCQREEEGMMMRVVELGMHVEDMEGMAVNGRGSLVVLSSAINDAWSNSRSLKGELVEGGLREYREQQRETMMARKCGEETANRVCMLGGAAATVAFFSLLASYMLL